jgi:hypothetical protein
MQRKKKLLIVGGGNLCLQILQILVPRDQFEFHVASRDLEKVTRLCNLVRLAALQLDVHAQIHCWKMDLVESDIERNAETLTRIRPDIILNCASLQSWRVITQLPKAAFEMLDQAQLGPWLPMHLAPAYALMRAVKHACPKTLVVNAAFPDAVNPVLYKVGLAPTVGIGNIANLVPATRSAIAQLARCEPHDVRVKLIGQHYFSHFVPRGGMPSKAHFNLNYWINGKDFSGFHDPREIFKCVAEHFRRLGGVDGQYLTAMSAVSVISNLFSDTEVHTHAPGPDGLPGGYPVKVGMGRVLLDIPWGVLRSVALDINNAGLRQDGIEAIHADGSVTFGAPHMAVMEEVLKYKCPSNGKLDVHNAAAHADALGRTYQTYIDTIRQQGDRYVTRPSGHTRRAG